MIKRFYILLLAIVASVGMSWAATVVTITTNDFPRSGKSFTKDGVTVSADYIDGDEGNLQGGGSFSTTLGNFTKIEVNARSVNVSGEGWSGFDNPTWTGNASSVSFSGDIMGMGMGVTTLKFTIEEAAPAGPIPCTAADLGKVLCTDGSIYATVSEATAASKTAAAVIAYVDTENGKALALALADDGEMEWATAKTTAPAHTPVVSNGTWTLASKDDWNNMITAAGSYTALRDGFSAVGGTNMQEDAYWSSTPENDNAWIFYFAYGGKWVDGYVDDPSYVRACLTFNIPAAPAYETVMNLINEIPNPVELTAECKAKIDAARAAYDALSDGDKAQVTNIATLTTAETDYAALAAAAAAPVIAQIEALPTTIKLSTYFSTYDLMVAARAAYNALSAEVQAAVTNLSKLTNLEAAFAAIGGANEKLSKPFSVGEGQVVYFSHGNLQATYNGTNWSWAFAAHQYDYIGDTSGNIIINGNGTLSGAGTVDLFGWVANSSTVLTSGVAKYGVSNSDNVSDYGLGTTETLKGDWGVAANDANIGGYNDWRILSNDEWVYLFKTRTDAASKYGYATVGGVNGVIILPDAFTDPMKNKGNKAFIPQNVDKGYSTNVYATGGDWEAMEAAGAVFMPAAGRRYGTTMTVNEGTGFYWSSTPMSYQASYFMGFMGSNVVPNNDRYRSHGLSVRLVSNNAPVASTPLDSALVVKDLIEAIPSTITLEDACVKAINDAREAYNKLSEAAKGLIDEATLAKLTDAEAALTALYQVEADKVIAKINNIPTPVTLKLATRDSIESARAAYEALNAEQKLLVSNYDVLTTAEAALAALNPGGGAPLPEGALTGAFSINADGDKIAFSKGNLQATTANLGETWTWAFAAHQYDYVGNAVANTAITGNKTVSTNGTIDLFGWSTAATYYGINNTNVSGKHPGDFIDWGETIAEGWRTLTRDEWGYLFETRTDAASKYGHATVAGIHGIIVLPDSYKGTAINADHSDWSNNIISAEDWAAYEANGVAFLPAAGSRLATSVNYVGEYAFYWTSTTYGEKWAYRVRFVPNLSPDYGDRVPGQSVRLVTAHTGSPTPLDSAQAVKDLIEAIPVPVTLDDACVNAVQAARDAYNELAEATKGALDAATVQKLNQAITDYTALIQAGADAVKDKIANIPQPVTLKLATRDSIQNARAAYDALTADQQALVSNYQTLLDAEAALAALNPGGGMPADALNGKFTINAGGDQIAFAKGNLQATTEDLGEHWTWSFAANQWNYLGIAVANSKINGNGTVSENGTVDLFGWSTAATYYGINNSYKAVDYIGDFVDWGPNMGAGWRTLTKDEWNYLIENNTKGRATVNDKNGYIFLPNDWSGPAFTPDPDNFTTNVYSGDDWTAMENAGAVFLPSGPARNGTYALIANDAKYSSSTSLNNDTSYVFTIYYNQSQSACTGTNRAYGCMVRLVTEGGGATPLDSAQAVKDLIEAIPVEITLDAACVKAIEDARAAYDALSDNAKGALDPADVKKLTDAEAALSALNKAEADKVVAKINNIPTPVELKLATRDSIESARAAYDALTAEQKALVPADVLKKLTDAEAALAEKNKGGSTPVDIVWDGNTGIANVDPNTTSPAYEGMTVTVGQGSSFSTYQNRLYFTFYSQPNGGYIFANENGTNITKVVIESTTALTSTMTEVDRMGSGWVISNENKTATWTGNTDSVSIWKGQSFANYWVVDMITFTVSASSTPLDSAQAVKDLIDAILTPIEYPTSGPAIAAALVAYQQLSDAAKGALDDADVQKMTDAAAQYAALDAIAAIEAIPAEIVYDPLVKTAIETARKKYDELIDASKALVEAEVLHKLTNAEQAWAILVAKIEHNVSYIGKDGEIKNEKVALLNIPDPAPELNGFEFNQWIVKAGDFLKDGLSIKAAYNPIITTKPAAFDTLVYNGTAQTLIEAGVAKEGHIEYRLNDGDWSTELPKADMAAAYAVYYKLVREAHDDYIADPINVTIAKAPVVYTAPAAYDTLVYNATNQTLIAAGQTNDGTLQYSFDPTLLDSWSAELPQAMAADTYNVYYRVKGDLNHVDSVAAAPIAVTIAKAELTATADDKDVIYGDAVPTYTATYAGWQGEDNDAVLSGKIAFACDYTPTSNVGIFAITPSGVSAANYDINFVNGKVTVAKADPVCTAPVAYDTLVYNGIAQTLIEAGVTAGGEIQYSLDTTLLGSWNTTLPQTKDAGAYKVFYRIKGDNNHNDRMYEDPVAVSIAKAALMITANNKNVTYGDSVPAYDAAFSGLQGEDTDTVVSGLAFTCAYAPTSNVAEYTITPNSATAANYAISYTNGKVTVGKAALMITAEDKNVTYGDAVPAYTATYSGWKNSDDATVVSNLAFTCAYAPTSSVAEYTITPNSATAANYAISYTNGKVTVAKAALMITAEDKNVTYGDAVPTYTATYSGWKNSDDATVVSGLAFTCTYAPTSNVAEYTITPNSATAANYAISYTNGKVTVAKAALMITAEDKNVTYGDTVPEYTVTYSGWKNSDDASVVSNLAYTCEYAPTSNVGEYTITPNSATATNYAISYTNGKVTVAKAALMITAEDKNVIYGDAVPAYTATYSGWKNSDDATVVSGLAYTCAYAPTSNVGEYTITPNSATATNYAISYTNGKVTVSKAALMITAEDKNVIYGDAVPTYTATYSGWKNSDDATVVSGLAFTCAYAPTSNVGEYTITPNSATAANYAISYTNGKVTVAKAALMITAEDKNVIYGDAVPTYTVTYSGWKNSDDATVVSNLAYTCEYAPTSNVGEYTITPNSATATNYAISYTNGKVTVAKAALMITAEDKNVIYGDAVPTYTATYSGWKNSDNASVVSNLAYTCEYAPTSNVGEYTITPNSATATNYAISYTNGKVTVGKAALMITAEDKNVIYGDAVPAYTATYSGWKNSDDASVVSNLAYTCEYAPTSSIGEYTITPNSATATNYDISYTNGKVTVAKAVLTITANDTVMIYGDEAPVFTASYSGWLNNDDETLVSGLAFTTPYQPGSPIGTYTINPNSATAQNYQIVFVDGKLTVNKAVVEVKGAQVHEAKFADGHAGAEVTDKGTLNGVKLNDPLNHITTASFSSAEVSEHLTITLFYELTGDAALLNNYDLQPTSEIFTTEGVIIEPFHPDTTQTKPGEEQSAEDQTVVQEGIEVYAYGYCKGDSVGLKYHLNSGNPDQYKIDFADSILFKNVDWTDLDITGPDGIIYIDVPVNAPTGDYQMTVYFRDSRFTWLESQALNVTFHVNLPETYVKPLFDNTIVLVDTCDCFTDIQWYYRETSSDPWAPIPGATGHYYRPENGTKLTGEYFVSAKMNGVPTYTCGQEDMETLYGAENSQPKAQVSAYPNPVESNTNVTIKNSTNWTHDLRVVNLMGIEVLSTSFEGDETIVNMDGFVSGNYMISVDGITVKVMKK